MTFQQRKGAFVQLGEILGKWAINGHTKFTEAYIHNNWFTEENIRKALTAWSNQLTSHKLDQWTNDYSFDDVTPKKVAIIMAGNIPLVGLHDLICVLLSGHKAIVKMSDDDAVLTKLVINELIGINPEFKESIMISEERLPKDFDAVIATGSNNTNRYFEYYFRNKPHLLRKNRNSVAVLTGNETPEDLQKLGDDIFAYFGLGCRNVSKLYVPMGYDFTLFFENIESHKDLIHHNKYANNYTYHKAIFLMNLTKHLDNGFLIVKSDEAIASPLSSIFYQEYDKMEDVNTLLENRKEEIQCVVGKLNGYIPFGKAQSPELSDYADGVDTMAFCLSL
jgi:hypothetical protein